jgi:formiminotetrahydrofolate cyclodeaminase
MARAAALGAAMNVRINLQGMADDTVAGGLLVRADAAVQATRRRASEVEAAVWEALGGPLLSDDVSDL